MAILTQRQGLQRSLGIQSSGPRLTGAREMNEREKALAAWVQTEADRCQAYMYPFHRQWYVNIAAATGAQGVQAETLARLLRVKVKTPNHRIRHQTNVVGGACRRLIGYLARSDPEFETMPADLDNPLQLDYAKAAMRYLEWLEHYDRQKLKWMRHIAWQVFTGTGISKAVYDYNSGPRQLSQGEDGQVESFSTGIPSHVVVPSFHWMYGIEARDQWELNWCGEDSWFSRATIDSIWPEAWRKHKMVPEPQYQRTRGYYHRQISQTIGPQGVYSGLQPESNVEGARVLQAYVRPFALDPQQYGQEWYEKGIYVVVVQGKVIHVESNPIMDLPGANPKEDWHPYVKTSCYSFPGRFLGQGHPENLIPLQDAINFINSRLRENQRKMGQQMWFIPDGSNVSPAQLIAEAGNPVKYNTQFGPPIAYVPGPLPNYLIQMLERYYEDIEMVGSNPPLMQGRAQGQIRSGVAVQSVQEQALTEFTPMIDELSEAKALMKKKLLQQELLFSETPRQIQWRGPQGWEQEVFFSQFLSPDFTVRVKSGSGIPQSKVLVMSEIDRLMAWGVLQPQVNPDHGEIVARSMGYNIPPITPDNALESLSSARYAIAKMLVGEETPVMHTDNHRVFINELIRFMQSRKFMELAEKDPTLHERFNYRLGKHRFFWHMQMMGADIPQPIPPFEDLQATFPEGAQQVQSMFGGGGGGGGGQPGGGGGYQRPSTGGPSTGAGMSNPTNGMMAPASGAPIQ